MVDSKDAQKLKVFISYSRADLAFADQLDAALAACGFAPILDRHDISGGEEWQARLSSLIQDADTILFVLSPRSAASDVCHWEVAQADLRGKRLIPVLCTALGPAPVPKRLQALNYIHFYAEDTVPGSGFGAGLARLIAALNTDQAWIREHSRLGSLAARWDAGGRTPERLLTGQDVADAKAWAARQPKDAPEPTVLQIALIKASEDAAAAARNKVALDLAERERIVQAAEADRTAREVALGQAEVALKETARLWRRQAWGAATAATIFGLVGWWGYGVLADQRAVTREAARENIRGQIVAFATAQGEHTADQAVGFQTSPYTTSLVEKLRAPNRSVSEALVDTHQFVTDLAQRTAGGRLGPQRPLFSTSMNGHVYLWRQPAGRRKHALLIEAGDIGVAGAELAGPPHDVAAVTQVLRDAGFGALEITRLENPSTADVGKTLAQLGAALAAPQPATTRSGAAAAAPATEREAAERPQNTFLFVFFSGHGGTIDGERFLYTNLTGVRLGQIDRNVVRDKALAVGALIKLTDEMAAASIVILDTHFPELPGNAATR